MRSRIDILKHYICDALHDLVAFVQFEKREKHQWRQKITLLHGCFSCFLNCTNDTKSGNASHMIQIERRSKQCLDTTKIKKL